MKTTYRRFFTWALLTLAILNHPLSTALAQGTAFTYQGQLQNNGSPANGTYNLTFTLFTTNFVGTTVVGPVTNNAVAVSNGLFTVTVDFGSSAFTGTSNWLQIGVETNGGPGFTTLSPQQRITPVPYAIYAENATVLANGVAMGQGTNNDISNDEAPESFIGGGTDNAIQFSYYSFVGGGNHNNIQSNSYVSFIGGGQNNFIESDSAISTIGGGEENQIQSYNLGSFIGGGFENMIGGDYNYWLEGTLYGSTISGGADNSIQTNSAYATIGGGIRNTIEANSSYSTIAGGSNNSARTNSIYAVVSGGQENFVSGSYGTVPGGMENLAEGTYSFAAGQQAQALHQGTFVWADSQPFSFSSTTNDEFDIRATNGVRIVSEAGIHLDAQNGVPLIVRDWDPFTSNAGYPKAGLGRWGLFQEFKNLTLGIPDNESGFVQVAAYNTNGTPTTLFQVDQNGDVSAKGTLSTYGFVVQPGIIGTLNVIGGSLVNSVSNSVIGATIAGGGEGIAGEHPTLPNTVMANYATISGGSANTASGEFAVVSGGNFNTASGISSVVSGEHNAANGDSAVVPGGDDNIANGSGSFAAGELATAGNNDSFVWSDGTATTSDTAANQFVARASGGFTFYTSSGNSGVSLPAGGGSWSSLSDRNSKEDLVSVDPQAVLAGVANLPMTTWRYKTEPGVRHVGPMAQDFYATFSVGEDNRHITEVDEGGVALAAIQGLDRKMESENDQLRAENVDLNRQNRELAQRLDDLEKTVQTLAQRK